MPESKTDASQAALADLLAHVLALANELAESDIFVKLGLTIPEWALLNEFPADGSEIVLKKLGASTGLSPQRSKVLVAKLESRGIVEAVPATETRRSARYVITPAGVSLKSAAEKAVRDMQAALLDPSQIGALARSVRIVRRLRKMAGRGQKAP